MTTTDLGQQRNIWGFTLNAVIFTDGYIRIVPKQPTKEDVLAAHGLSEYLLERMALRRGFL